MSSNNQRLNTGSQLTTDYDLSKIFIWDNRYETMSLTNSEYSPWTLLAGTVMGRIAGLIGGLSTVFPTWSGATDGSQIPIGILAQDITVQNGTTVNVSICVKGDVSKSQLITNPADTLNTVIPSRQQTIYDLLQAAGVKIVDDNDMTNFDN